MWINIIGGDRLMSLFKMLKKHKPKSKDESKSKSSTKKHKESKPKKKRKEDSNRTSFVKDEIRDVEETHKEQVLEEMEIPSTPKLSKKKGKIKEHHRNFQQNIDTVEIIDLNSDNE